jgi:hypothetical protein
MRNKRTFSEKSNGLENPIKTVSEINKQINVSENLPGANHANLDVQ